MGRTIRISWSVSRHQYYKITVLVGVVLVTCHCNQVTVVATLHSCQMSINRPFSGSPSWILASSTMLIVSISSVFPCDKSWVWLGLTRSGCDSCVYIIDDWDGLNRTIVTHWGHADLIWIRPLQVVWPKCDRNNCHDLSCHKQDQQLCCDLTVTWPMVVTWPVTTYVMT